MWESRAVQKRAQAKRLQSMKSVASQLHMRERLWSRPCSSLFYTWWNLPVLPMDCEIWSTPLFLIRWNLWLSSHKCLAIVFLLLVSNVSVYRHASYCWANSFVLTSKPTSAINVMSTFIHNEPTSLPILQETKLPQSFLSTITEYTTVSTDVSYLLTLWSSIWPSI